MALVFYGLFRLFQGTQAVALLRGILVIALIFVLAASRFTAFGWLLRNSLPIILVAIPVIFQPELRRALERLGRSAPLMMGRGAREAQAQQVIHEIAQAVELLARERTGALIVLEGETGLEEYIESGERIDAGISARLLTTVFFPGTPLHDGAVIIRGDRIVAAACVLPLTQRDLADSSLGTRHRAAVGITEQNDAVAIVVSEETGIVSLARAAASPGGWTASGCAPFYRRFTSRDACSMADRHSGAWPNAKLALSVGIGLVGPGVGGARVGDRRA